MNASSTEKSECPKFIARFEALEAQLPEWERYPTGAATCEDAP